MAVSEFCLMSRLIWLSLFSLCVCLATSASAAIIGVVPGSNSVTFTAFVGGVPYAGPTAPVPIDQYPVPTTFPFTPALPTAGFTAMDISYRIAADEARVFIPNTGLTAIASQGTPAPSDGPISVRADFSISFAVDAAGTAGSVITIDYPIAFGMTDPGMFDSFDAEVDYTSAADGFLGTSEAHFALVNPGPGPIGSPFFRVIGANFALPALDPLDTLTLSGFFRLEADGFSGGSTEIQVFGMIPEPSTLMLLATGFVGMAMFGRSRRR